MKGETEQGGQGSLDPEQVLSMTFWDNYSTDDQQIYFNVYSKRSGSSTNNLLGNALASDKYIEFNLKLYQ